MGVYIFGERRYFFGSRVGGSWGAKRGYRIVISVINAHTANGLTTAGRTWFVAIFT